MADPDHVPNLDRFDERTVRLYRGGLAVCALGLLMAAVLYLTMGAVPGLVEYGLSWLRVAWVVLVYGVGLSVLDMHLYDKKIRWSVAGAGWLGTVLVLAAAVMASSTVSWWVEHAGVGFLFVAVSGFALKEQFCFRIPFLRAMPVLLALTLIPMLGRLWVFAGIGLLLAAGLQAVLAVAKLRMPLHYDIGDKSKYQI